MREPINPDNLICIPRAQYEALMAAAKLLPRMHKAADILMARLISKDDNFLPSKSTVWPDIVASHEAITALRAAGIAEAALSGKEIPDWKKPLYEDGKTPDKKAVDEAADEFRRKNIALSGKEER